PRSRVSSVEIYRPKPGSGTVRRASHVEQRARIERRHKSYRAVLVRQPFRASAGWPDPPHIRGVQCVDRPDTADDVDPLAIGRPYRVVIVYLRLGADDLPRVAADTVGDKNGVTHPC